jgi:WD40 repeat protein
VVTGAYDRSDRLLATGDAAGTVRVGPASGGEPHLLLGHKGTVWSLTFSPDGHWLASSGDDGTIRLWPVPDVTEPPLHTLPLDVLLARLRTHTNLRAVPDPRSSNGYKLEPGPFPGWAHPPEW